MTDRGTVEDALRRHYAASGLPIDGGRLADGWILRIGPLSLRRSRTLYSVPSTTDLRSLPVTTLRGDCLPAEQRPMTFADLALYCLLVALSLAVLVAPIVLLVAVFG